MADTNDTNAEGNTRPQQLAENSKIRSRKWVFTLNNYSNLEYSNLTQITHTFTHYIIGKEVGEGGTPHLQCYIEFKNARNFNAIKKLIPRAHIEKAKGSAKDNYNYCSKDGDFISNMDFSSPIDKIKQLCLAEYKDVSWKPWQQEILDLKNDPRSIHWYYEPTGNVGKSFLAKYLALTRNIIICEGKKNDVYNAINSMYQEGKYPDIVLCDVPRTSIDYINYGAIESIKNGLIYSGKYEGGLCIFPPPIVICLANTPPIECNLSSDRWVIRRIGSL